MDLLRGFSSSYVGGVDNTTALQYNNMEASRYQGFLGLLDPPMCPRVTVIIPGLLRSKNKLEDEVKELKATIGKKNFIIFFLIVLVALMFMYYWKYK
ncbi:hypothetical protein R6Q59_036101 [Mikania micrantha]